MSNLIKEKLQAVYENSEQVKALNSELGQIIYGNDKQKSYYDMFWECHQDSGNRLNYNYGFAGTGWTEDNFYPKFNMKPTMSYMMFYNNRFSGDLAQRFLDCGVSLDLSNVTDGVRTFMYAGSITRIGSINVSSLKTINEFFSWCQKLVTVDEFVVTETTTSGTNMFNNCYELQNIVFNGTIGFSIGLPQSTKLTKASILNIFSCLSSTASGKSLTLSQTAVNNAFEGGSTGTEWLNLVATKPNWTISLS